MTTVLIADDNRQITSILEEYAKREGYATLIAYDGVEALSLFETHQPDVVLLDVMMPKKNGFDVCRAIRERSRVPVILVTARSDDFDKIMGLDIGADDYIVKPFSPQEVMARVRAVLRRMEQVPEDKQTEFTFDTLHISLADYVVRISGKEIPLTKKELEILWTLVTHPSKVFSRDNLLNSLWGYDYLGDSRTVDSHIKRLRAKLDKEPHERWEIRTIWGVGYKFEEKP